MRGMAKNRAGGKLLSWVCPVLAHRIFCRDAIKALNKGAGCIPGVIVKRVGTESALKAAYIIQVA